LGSTEVEGVEGPFDFTSAEIDAKVLPRRIGSYVLGKTRADGSFNVRYVGRSDADLNIELKKRLTLGYPAFKFQYVDSSKDAFIRESKNYHFVGGKAVLDNERHPDRPDGMNNLKCPVPGCTELQ
jgi:hypothetical protein